MPRDFTSRDDTSRYVTTDYAPRYYAMARHTIPMAKYAIPRYATPKGEYLVNLTSHARVDSRPNRALRVYRHRYLLPDWFQTDYDYTVKKNYVTLGLNYGVFVVCIIDVFLTELTYRFLFYDLEDNAENPYNNPKEVAFTMSEISNKKKSSFSWNLVFLNSLQISTLRYAVSG